MGSLLSCLTSRERERTPMADAPVLRDEPEPVPLPVPESEFEPEPEPEPVPLPVSQPVQPATIPEHQPYRTGYHFQPARNWMNDPNGPMFHNGIYHLFYQYNPDGPVWGGITWAHSTSTDLVNWIHRQHAIHPTDPFDSKGCWSGSTTIRPGGKPAILYTGGARLNDEPLQEDDPNKHRQVQVLAVPKDPADPLLIEWIKPPQNPVMVPPSGVADDCFRDPSTAWQGPDGRWRVIVGGAIGRRGMAFLYTSDDEFVQWIESDHPLHSSVDSGMWECLEFFPVSINSKDGIETSVNNATVKHVLKFSLCDNMKDYYTVGTYNQVEDRYIPDPGSIENCTGLGLDYGRFYASKSFFDSARNRRILTSWVNEACSEEQDILKGWSGLQGIPRSIWLDKTGNRLIQWPVDELERLRTNRVDLSSTVLRAGSVLRISGVTASQADVEVSFELAELEKAEQWDPSWVDPQVLCNQKDASKEGVFGPFGLLVLASELLEEETTTLVEKIKEQTAIFFRVFKDQNKYKVVMGNDLSRSRSEEQNGLNKTGYGAFLEVDPLHEKISLRTLIDHSIVESFGGEGKTCITSRVYPKLAIDDEAHLYVFNYGTENVKISSFSAWSMKNAVIN